jgi:hypothetical protein
MGQAEQDRSERERELERKIRRLEEENKGLKDENHELRKKELNLKDALDKALTELARAHVTSHNSSKRPSSDIVKSRRAQRDGKLKIGGQPGHPKHTRQPLGPAEIDRHVCYLLTCCPECLGPCKRARVCCPMSLSRRK